MAQVTNMTDVPFRDMMQDGLVGRRKVAKGLGLIGLRV